jgi:hypothetical protein
MTALDETPVAIELQLAPEARVTGSARDIVATAFGQAELKPTWAPLPGDRSVEPGAPRAADASLAVRIRSSADLEVVDLLIPLRKQLGSALSYVRSHLPDLPVGLEILRPGGRLFLAFAPTAPPSAMSQALDAVADAEALESSVVGWDSTAGKWVAL